MLVIVSGLLTAVILFVIHGSRMGISVISFFRLLL